MEIIYLKGDATNPQVKGNKLICHICNDRGRWGKGFVLAVSKRWLKPEKQYKKWFQERGNNNFGLGAIQSIQVQPDIWVVNMIAQHGIITKNQDPPIRYYAVRMCLEKVTSKAKIIKCFSSSPKNRLWTCRWKMGIY